MILFLSCGQAVSTEHPYTVSVPVIAIDLVELIPVPVVPDYVPEPEPTVMKITAYTAHDAGMNGRGKTASGEKVQEGRTIAADESIPFGTEIYIPALEFHTDCPVQELPKAEMDQVLIIDVKLGPDPTRGIDVTKVEDLRIKPKDTEIKPDEPTTTKSSPTETPIPQSVTSPDPVPKLRRNFEEVWQDARDDITQLRVMYDEQADDDFRKQLINLVLAVTKGRGLVG